MTKPWLSTGEKGTEVFAADQLEARARRTKFVQRAAKLTGKVFLALVRVGRWSAGQTTVPQLAATAAPLDSPVNLTPEALQHRLTGRAGAVLPEGRPSAVAKLQTGDPRCAAGIFAPFPRVPIAASPGFAFPESLAKECPGAGGSGSKAGAKSPLGWEDTRHTCAHCALLPWHVPESTSVATVVEVARASARWLFDVGDFKLAAVAQSAVAPASCLSRLNPQATRREVGGGRPPAVELATELAGAPPPVVEKAVGLGAYERVPARRSALRLPAALVPERRRRAPAVATQPGYTPSPAQLPLLAWKLFIPPVPAPVWPPQTGGSADS